MHQDPITKMKNSLKYVKNKIDGVSNETHTHFVTILPSLKTECNAMKGRMS